MKKIISFFILILLSISLFNLSFANSIEIDNNEGKIIDKTIEIDNGNIKILPIPDKKIKDLPEINFEVKKFESCSEMNSIIKKQLKSSGNYYGGPIRTLGGDVVFDEAMEDSVLDNTSPVATKSITQSTSGVNTNSYIDTNTQVQGVDEAEIIKTNGKYIYFYNSKAKNIKIYNSKDLRLVDTIKLPKDLYNIQMFLDDKKLTIVGNMYSKNKYYNVNTFIIVYDLNKNGLKIGAKKISKINGDIKELRKIDNLLYVITNVSLYNFVQYNKEGDEFSINLDKNIPNTVLVEKTKKGINYTKTENTCSDIEYILPQKKNNSSQMLIITTIDLENLNENIPQKIIFGDIKTIYMSKDSLFLTSNLYIENNYRCSFDFCIMPYFENSINTLIHKYSIDGKNLKYNSHQLVEGSSLTQYSMNESNGYFNIITQNNNGEQGVNIYSFDKNMKLLDKLDNVGKGEKFKSSRYMGNKLYLVTFKQIDPLFVIDLEDKKDLKILGELKIPGYSTYLHPIDENHILGMGYDTFENKWGGTQNSGIKIDIYNVEDFKNPKQEHTLTIGKQGTYSEVLNNPRMFTYDKEKGILAFPINKQTNESDDYRERKVFQGSEILKIDIESGIKILKEISHFNLANLEKDRQKECLILEEKINKEINTCTILLSGNKVCIPKNYIRIPKYCEHKSDLDLYVSSHIYNYNNDKIIRNLIIDDNVYSLSNNGISRYDIGDDKDYYNFR